MSEKEESENILNIKQFKVWLEELEENSIDKYDLMTYIAYRTEIDIQQISGDIHYLRTLLEDPMKTMGKYLSSENSLKMAAELSRAQGIHNQKIIDGMDHRIKNMWKHIQELRKKIN